jgi:hypothetical protein
MSKLYKSVLTTGVLYYHSVRVTASSLLMQPYETDADNVIPICADRKMHFQNSLSVVSYPVNDKAEYKSLVFKL